MDQEHPFFSISILYWNSDQTIDACLDALNAQTDQDFEILLIDNGSTQPISRRLIEKYSRLPINLFTLEHNFGFAGGNNFASAKAKGEYLVLLNADDFPGPDWLENIRDEIRHHPGCFFSSQLIMANDPCRLDGPGG